MLSFQTQMQFFSWNYEISLTETKMKKDWHGLKTFVDQGNQYFFWGAQTLKQAQFLDLSICKTLRTAMITMIYCGDCVPPSFLLN